jgi:hypothetical protein
METVSSREFMAHPERYLEMAANQDIRIKKGRKVFRIVYEAPVPEPPILEPDDDFRRAITIDELKARMRVSIHKFFADKHKQ